MSARRSFLLAIAMVAVLSGCVESNSAHPEGVPGLVALSDTASPEQVDAMADGEISEEEYTAGYLRFVACIRNAGYEIEELGRPSTVYEASLPRETVESGIDEECYAAEFRAIDIVWQTENPPWTEVGERLKECLADADLATDGDENELKERMIENGLDIPECMGIDVPPPS